MEENKNIWVWALAAVVLFFLLGNLGMGIIAIMDTLIFSGYCFLQQSFF